MVAKKAAANLENPLVEQSTDLERHGLFLAAEADLMSGDPVDLPLGDNAGGERLQINLPEVHDRWRWGGDRMGKVGQRNAP